MFVSGKIKISNENFIRRTCFMCDYPGLFYVLEQRKGDAFRVLAPYCNPHAKLFGEDGYSTVARQRVDINALL